MDKIIKLLFGFLLAFFFLVIAILTSTQPENVTGIVDTTFTTIQHSGETVASNPTSKWLAYFFGIGIISFFSFFVFIGARKKQDVLRKKMFRVLTIGTAFYLIVYSIVVFSWWDYVQTNSMDYFMGLPKPTAWMIFALLFFPLFISYFYVTKFNDWIITTDEKEKFKEIVANRRKRK